MTDQTPDRRTETPPDDDAQPVSLVGARLTPQPGPPARPPAGDTPSSLRRFFGGRRATGDPGHDDEPGDGAAPAMLGLPEVDPAPHVRVVPATPPPPAAPADPAPGRTTRTVPADRPAPPIPVRSTARLDDLFTASAPPIVPPPVRHEPDWDAMEIPVRLSAAERAGAPLRGPWRIAVAGVTGGAGRTTVAVGTAMALAGVRPDPLVVVDTGPDRHGSLLTRAGATRGSDVRALADALHADAGRVRTLDDVRRFVTTGGESGVEVLGGVPGVTAPALTPDEVRTALTALERTYPLLLLDCAAGWGDAATNEATDDADLMVLVTRATAPDLLAADDALTALAASGRVTLAAGPVVAVVHTARSRWGTLGQGAVTAPALRSPLQRLGARASTLVHVPYDPWLAAGHPLTPERLRRATKAAFLELGAAIVEHCSHTGTKLPVPEGKAR